MNIQKKIQAKNDEIDKLAQSIKFGQLSPAWLEYKTMQLYKALLRYKKVYPMGSVTATGNVEDDVEKKYNENTEDDVEKKYNEKPEVYETDEFSVTKDRMYRTFANFAEIDVTTEEVEKAYFAAWKLYTFENQSFILLFNKCFKVEHQSHWDDVKKCESVNYKFNKTYVKMIIRDLVSQLHIKDFEMPDNPYFDKDKRYVRETLIANGATQQMLDQYDKSFDQSIVVSHVQYVGEDAEEIDLYDQTNDTYEEKLFFEDENYKTLVEHIGQAYSSCESNIQKKYFRCLIGMALVSGEIPIGDNLKEYVDMVFVNRFKEAYNQKPDGLDYDGFAAEYLRRERETVQKTFNEIRQKITPIWKELIKNKRKNYD